MESTFVIICLAVSPEVIDAYIHTAPRNTVALLADRVQLDCITNSSRLVDWRLKRYDSGQGTKEEWVSRGNNTHPNISGAFSLLRNKVGQFALVIDPMLMSLAGRYECEDKGEEKVTAEVAVLNGTPSCNTATSNKIVCIFVYAGNLTPNLDWLTMGNFPWDASWNASNGTVECSFESSCTVNRQSTNESIFTTICNGENSTCKWGSNSGSNLSSGGLLLLINGYNRTIGGWECSSIGVSSTSSNQSDAETPEGIGLILLLICVGVTSAAIILVSFSLHRKYGISNKNRMTPDALHNATSDQENPVQTQTETNAITNGSVNMMSIYSILRNIGEPENIPVYGQVQKKRTAAPKMSVNANENVIFENSIYSSTTPRYEAKGASETSTNNFDMDGIIYAELSRIPKDTSSRIKGVPVFCREGFDTSTYASIDHNLRPPPLLPPA